MWKSSNSSNPYRQGYIAVRKSERLRLLEMQIIRLEFELDLLNNMLATLLEANSLQQPQLDAGKWYRRRLEKDS